MTKSGLLAAAAVLAAATGAFAGAHSYFPLNVNSASHWADGGLAETHNTADSTQYAECGTNSNTGYCTFRDSGGTYYSCYTTDASQIAVIRALSADGTFDVVWDPSTSVCTYVLEYATSRAAQRLGT